MANKALIISGFQGIGKSTYARTHLKCVDLESSNFDKTNKNWYKDYCKTALDLMSQGYTVFVSSHKVVRDYLLRETPYYIMVAPTLEQKEMFINRVKARYHEDPNPKNYRAYKAAEFDYDSYIVEIKNDKYLPVYWLREDEPFLTDDVIRNIKIEIERRIA